MKKKMVSPHWTKHKLKIKCSSCNGSGYMFIGGVVNHLLDCWTCSGFGKIEVEDKRINSKHKKVKI